MKNKLFLAILIAVFGIVPLTAQDIPTEERRKGYLLGPGDEVTGKVLGEQQFDFVATIDEDGMIEVPFFDKPVLAMCKTESDLRVEISKLLSRYLKSPQMSLRVTQRNSRPPVSIYGEVRQQQQVVLSRRAYLLELISFAGGVTEKSGGMVQVFRTKPPLCAAPDVAKDWVANSENALDVPSRMYSLASLRQGREEANPEIFPGDIIVVQKASPIYVVGEVVKPGEMSIPEGGLPLMQAVAMASGMTRDAKTKEIKVYRRKEGSAQPEVIAVNYGQIRSGTQKDVMLMPFDIVEVGKAKKSFSDIMMDMLIGLPNRIPIPVL